MIENKTAGREGGVGAHGREGWRVVVKMGERLPQGGKRRWELVVRPPGSEVRLISSFETSGREFKREEFALGLLGCIERLLDRVAPGGLSKE